MKVNGYKCETCPSLCDGDKLKGWFFVRFHETNSGYREQHFCSLECLISWASQQSVDSTEYVSDEFGGLIKVTSNGEK